MNNIFKINLFNTKPRLKIRTNFYNKVFQQLIHNHSIFFYFIFIGLLITANPTTYDTKFYLQNKNYVLNHLKILGLYPLLENFIIKLTLTNYFKVKFYSKTYLKPNTKAMTILLKP